MSKKYTVLILFFELYINFLLYLQLFIYTLAIKYLFLVIVAVLLCNIPLINTSLTHPLSQPRINKITYQLSY